MTTRKKYSKEYNLDAVSLVLDQGYTVSEAAKSLEVNRSILQRWINELQSDDGQAFRGNGKLTPEQAEIRRLKEENWTSINQHLVNTALLPESRTLLVSDHLVARGLLSL